MGTFRPNTGLGEIHVMGKGAIPLYEISMQAYSNNVDSKLL